MLTLVVILWWRGNPVIFQKTSRSHNQSSRTPNSYYCCHSFPKRVITKDFPNRKNSNKRQCNHWQNRYPRVYPWVSIRDFVLTNPAFEDHYFATLYYSRLKPQIDLDIIRNPVVNTCLQRFVTVKALDEADNIIGFGKAQSCAETFPDLPTR